MIVWVMVISSVAGTSTGMGTPKNLMKVSYFRQSECEKALEANLKLISTMHLIPSDTLSGQCIQGWLKK